MPKITAIEFGVVGGNGLLAIEKAGSEVERETGVGIETCGFDTGSGLPESVDYRDEPYIYGHGQHTMGQSELRSRLKRSRIIFAMSKKQYWHFAKGNLTAPIGFGSFDLDFHSSTVAGLKIFNSLRGNFLLRVFVISAA